MSQFNFSFQVASNKIAAPASAPVSVSTSLLKNSATVLGGRYFIPKSCTTPNIMKTIVKDLTITDPHNAWDVKEMKAYEDTDEGVYVPRFYGVEKFGAPGILRLNPGYGMQPGLKCNMIPSAARRQPEALEIIRQAFNKKNQWGGFLCLPCGYGKTDTAIKAACETGVRALVVVPDSVLFQQWQERILLRVPGVKVGVLQQNNIEVDGCDFVVAMVHSLAGRDNYPLLDTFGLMILDEAHHMSAPMFSRALIKVPAQRILALSATPKRSNAAETQLLFWYMGPILFKPSRPPNECVQVKMLWYTQSLGKEIATKPKDGAKKKPLCHLMLQKMIDDKRRTNILLDHILDYYHSDEGRNILVISKRLNQLKNLHSLLIKHDVTENDIGFLIGSVKPEQRNIEKNKRIVLAIEKLGKEGLDAPHLNTLIVALPLSDIEQPTGRIQRNAEHDQENSDQPDSKFIPPHVVYLVDPYSLYEGMAYKNMKQFRSFGYTVDKIDLSNYKPRYVVNL